jgi:tRNA dimethylallyltransferase
LSDTTEAETARDIADAAGRVRVLAVVGPTAVGKTALAEALAQRLGGEIVSADSMQVYRGMDIGTAKSPVVDRLVPYQCIDLADPGEAYSAALFQRDARAAISGIAASGALPVLCGGTGLYVRAALDDWEFPAGEVASAARGRYEALAVDIGAPALHALLAERDPASAALVHVNNTRRVVRALEMLDEGASYSSQSVGFSERRSVYDVSLLGLTMDREALYRQIDARVDAMFERGLLDEVRRLLGAGYRDALTAAQAIGYKELVPVVESGAEIEHAVAAIKRATRRYAKRQLTWFRADPRVRWLDITGLAPAEALREALEIVTRPVT